MIEVSELKPYQITFDITDRCQMKCVTCSKWNTDASEVINKELTTEEWKKILFNMKEWINSDFWFCFSGGEPFLRDDIIEIAQYAKTIGVHPMTMTNGFSLDGKEEQIVENFDVVNVSLNAINDPLVHDNSRGREGSYRKAVDSILKMNEYRLKSRPEMVLNISTIILSENVSELTSLVNFVKESNLSGIMFQLYEDIASFHSFNTTRFIQTNDYVLPDSLKLAYKKMVDNGVIEVLGELIELKKQGAPINNSLEQLKAFKSFLLNPDDLKEHLGCGVGQKNFAIDPYGNVRICFNMAPIGSLREKTPDQIWTSPEAGGRRRAIRKCNMYCRLLSCNI